MDMPRICSKCNQEVDEKAKFCSNCGGGEIIEMNTNPVGNAPTQTAPVASTPAVQTISPTEIQAAVQPSAAPANTNPVAVEASTQPATGVVEFPVGQQTNQTSSQLQSMPEVHSTNPVSPTPTPAATMQTPMMTPGAIPNNGVIDNNSFGGNVNRSKHKKRGANNNMMWVLFGAGGIIILLLVILIIILLFSNKFGGNTQPYSFNGNDEDSIRIGNGSFGYLTVPKNWNVFIDENAQNTIQYTDGAGWIVTLFATSNSVIASKNWATNVANQMQNDGAIDVAMGEDSVNNYHGYKVFGYYENSNTYLAAWFFEAEDGNTHYIAIEGPNRYDDNYDIIYTFNLKQ